MHDEGMEAIGLRDRRKGRLSLTYRADVAHALLPMQIYSENM